MSSFYGNASVGSGLPQINNDDNGKVLIARNGDWELDFPSADGLPSVTENDNGKTLVVENGSWNVGDSAEGLQNLVDGSAQGSVRGINTAIEDENYTIGVRAFAEGSGTKASGDYSHAEGGSTTASGYCAHAEGNNTEASGNYSHAAGLHTTANGEKSYAEGERTIANGKGSHVEGNYTFADGDWAHAEGIGTSANHKSQHVFGEYNIRDSSAVSATQRGTYVEIVGNGTSISSTSNARTLDWNGNEVLAGKLTVGANPVNNMDVTTKQYVDNKTQSFIVHVSEGTQEVNGSQRHYYILDQTAEAIIAAYQQTQVILEYELPSDNTAFPGYTIQYLCQSLLFKYNESNDLIDFVLPTLLNNNTTFTATRSIDFPTYYQEVAV